MTDSKIAQEKRKRVCQKGGGKQKRKGQTHAYTNTRTHNTHTAPSLVIALSHVRVASRVALDRPYHQLHDRRQRVIRRRLLGRHALHVVLEEGSRRRRSRP